ncbi:MAG: hypothetical protein AAB304_02990 [Pseudomonadota bacterium]
MFHGMNVFADVAKVASESSDRMSQGDRRSDGLIEVKLPPGLYLFQPNFKTNVLGPLFIVEDGRLVDPYIRVQKIGLAEFGKKYIQQRTFNAYSGTERIGKFENNAIDESGFPCSRKSFSTEIFVTSRYTGAPLPGEYVFEHSKNPFIENLYEPVRVIATPESFSKSVRSKPLTVDKHDIARAAALAKGKLRSSILALLTARKDKYFFNEKANRSYIDVDGQQVDISAVILLQATDLNGNGKKELVGVYALSVVDEKSQDSGIFKTPFVVWDNDEVEMLMPPLQTPRIFAGAIDIDQDGQSELVVQEGIDEKDSDEPEMGKRIGILHRLKDGWKLIYQTLGVGCL